MTTVSDNTSDSEALRVATDRQMLDYRTAIPGVVESVAPDGTWVNVRPAVNMVQSLDGQTKDVPMPVLQKVPLMIPGSKTLGLFVCVPVVAGDDGLLVVCDRAIDNWQFGSGVSRSPDAPSPRHHDLTDAVFIPGLQRMSGAIDAYPTNGIEIRTTDGAVKLRVDQEGVFITGNLTVSGVVVDGAGIPLGTHKHGGVQTGGGQTGVPVP